MTLPQSPLDAKRAFLLLALGALIVCAIVGYHAASNEISGTATWRQSPGWKGMGRTPAEFVTRESSPAKFHQATNLMWGMSGLCLVVAAIAFILYHKLDDNL